MAHDRLRAELLDLADAPRLPVDFGSYVWEEPFPGIRLATVKEDASRGFRASLLWARPGARFPRHRHGGDETVLVLQGRYSDEGEAHGPGQIARRLSGSVHSIEILPGDDCLCYVLSYGDLEIL